MNYAIVTLFKNLNSIDIDMSLILAKDLQKFEKLQADKVVCVNAINKIYGTRNNKVNIDRAIDLLNAELKIQERLKNNEKAQNLRNAILQLYN